MKIDNDVLVVLSESAVDGKGLKLPGWLDRAMYMKVNKVIEACGGKWDKKAKLHLFPTDANERVDQILLTGEVEIPKDEFDFFETPAVVVERLIELANIQKGMSVLEPSAGRGAIAYPIAKLGGIVDCCELMTDNYKALDKALCRCVVQQDFLTVEPTSLYYRVVMNPPFSKQADILHVKHAFQFLKPKGILVAVMSAGVMFRENKFTTEFRAFVKANNGEIEDLPEKAFKQSGTNVNTCIVTLYKE